jgi:5-bromo-4-chloroindolyl phosphate hydrolysis protein
VSNPLYAPPRREGQLLPPPLPSARPEPVHRARAWAPVLKSAALFLLPAPLPIAALVALVGDDVQRLALSGGALACFWTAGVLCWQALVAEARYLLGERLDLPPVPRKLVSALFTTSGAALSALAGGHTIVGTAIFAGLGGFGHLAFYGRDLRPRRIEVKPVEGVDVSAVGQQLQQAYQRLRRIESAARSIAVPEFTDRLKRIIGIGTNILGEIERDPREASRARRFLNLYLDSTERVTQEFARTQRQGRSEPLEQRFRQLLIDMENSFTQQHRRLLEHDTMALDVDMEVLSARLKREGVVDQVETRS